MCGREIKFLATLREHSEHLATNIHNSIHHNGLYTHTAKMIGGISLFSINAILILSTDDGKLLSNFSAIPPQAQEPGLLIFTTSTISQFHIHNSYTAKSTTGSYLNYAHLSQASRIYCKYYQSPHPPLGTTAGSKDYPGHNPYVRFTQPLLHVHITYMAQTTLKEQKTFEKGLLEKTAKTNADISKAHKSGRVSSSRALANCNSSLRQSRGVLQV